MTQKAEDNMKIETLEEIREVFKKDRFATENGMVVDELGEDYAVCSMETTEHHLNAADTVMGGVYFTLADFAFAVLANHLHAVTVTLNSDITFLSSAKKGSRLIARAECVRSGKTTTCCRVEIRDNEGRLCTISTSNGFKL